MGGCQTTLLPSPFLVSVSCTDTFHQAVPAGSAAEKHHHLTPSVVPGPAGSTPREENEEERKSTCSRTPAGSAFWQVFPVSGCRSGHSAGCGRGARLPHRAPQPSCSPRRQGRRAGCPGQRCGCSSALTQRGKRTWQVQDLDVSLLCQEAGCQVRLTARPADPVLPASRGWSWPGEVPRHSPQPASAQGDSQGRK